MKTGALTVGSSEAVRLTQTGILALKADPGNTNNIYVGDEDVSSSNGYPLDAGQELVLGMNVSDVWVIGGDTGQSVRWLIA